MGVWVKVFGLVAVLGAATVCGAQVVKVDLRNAGPREVERELQQALGAPVEVRGGIGRTVTLNLATGSPTLTLDRVAAVMGGSWRMKLRVRPGIEPAAAARPVLDRNLTLGIRDLAASRAFAVIARELRADLETEGELDAPVTLAPVNLPASELLDRVAGQAKASWSIRYVIHAPDAPPAPEPRESDLDLPDALPALPRSAPGSPPARVVLQIPSAAGFKRALWADMHQLLRADPSQRAAAVRQFVSTGEQRVAALATLNASQRRARIQAARPLLTHWRRMYQGLAPEVKRELQPAAAFLERTLN